MEAVPECGDELFTYAKRWFGVCVCVNRDVESVFSSLRLTVKHVSYSYKASRRQQKAVGQEGRRRYFLLLILWVHTKRLDTYFLGYLYAHYLNDCDLGSCGVR